MPSYCTVISYRVRTQAYRESTNTPTRARSKWRYSGLRGLRCYVVLSEITVLAARSSQKPRFLCCDADAASNADSVVGGDNVIRVYCCFGSARGSLYDFWFGPAGQHQSQSFTTSDGDE